MPRAITPGSGPSPSPTEESVRSDTSKRKTAAYSPYDEVMIIDTGFKSKPTSSFGKAKHQRKFSITYWTRSYSGGEQHLQKAKYTLYATQMTI